MHPIKIEKNLTETELKQRGVFGWSIWEKEISEFPWTYNGQESCYILQGRVEVRPENTSPVIIEAGDFVVFPDGMNCTWNVIQPLRKHYSFD